MSKSTVIPTFRRILDRGVVIPASPLALTAQRKLDERRQLAIWRYYSASGAGGIAVGVHATQFEIRDKKIGLFQPVLELAAEEMTRLDARRDEPLIRIAGICGKTNQAIKEAGLARELGYHAGLLSPAAFRDSVEEELIKHCATVSQEIPLVGFYLQPAVGGLVLPYSFWHSFAQIESVVAIKIAPFNRYQTIDVVRAVTEAGRDDIALYTGNDDNIVIDLLTSYQFEVKGRHIERRMVGGILGHWAVWTAKAVKILETCHKTRQAGRNIPEELLQINIEVTDSNAAIFDVANNFAGCIAGIHEVLRRQGLLEGTWCLNREETLSPGQAEEIDRVYRVYPHLNDDLFVSEHLHEWLV